VFAVVITLATGVRPTGPLIHASNAISAYMVLVDDFVPQPLQGQSVWSFPLTGGDRGNINTPSGGSVVLEPGLATARIAAQNSFVGMFATLNHPIREGDGINFSSIFPSQILGPYQGRVTQLRIQIQDGRGTFKAELQAPNDSLPWQDSITLTGGPRTLEFNLPALGKIRNINWLVIGNAGDFTSVERIELRVEAPQLTTAEQAFLWSYAMLLNNWVPSSGLTRDRSNVTAREFINVSASGLQAPAAVVAARLGFISEVSARQIVNSTASAILALPRCHGVLPHFVTNGSITEGTEWSSIDSVIALLALIEAQQAVGIDTSGAIGALRAMDWADLLLPSGSISHGYDHSCQRLDAAWRDFGTESWLVIYAHMVATGNLATMDHTPPTYNGSGFIDPLGWLFVPAPTRDRFGIDWPAYVSTSLDTQLAYYHNHPCFGPPRSLFGLSAAEVPSPWRVAPSHIYSAFGVGGHIPANDGVTLMGHGVVTPHYIGLAASRRPAQAVAAWRSLQDQGLISPLNNVESLMWTDEPTCARVEWNALKGSWNLGLQTLGWGQLLTGTNPLYEAMAANPSLRQGYAAMTEPSTVATTPTATTVLALTWTPTPTPTVSATATAQPSLTEVPTVAATPSRFPTATPNAVGGRGFTISSDGERVRLSWLSGKTQTGYSVLRLAGGVLTTLPTSGILPMDATNYSDASAPPGLDCYVVLAVGIIPQRQSDALCSVVGFHSVNGSPTNFAMSLNQSSTASFTWGPPSGAGGAHDAYMLMNMRTGVRQTLGGAATSATAAAVGLTCFALGAMQNDALSGHTDILCGLPGFTNLDSS